VRRGFHFDHSIRPILRPKLHQIWKSRSVPLKVTHDPFKPKSQMRRGETPQCTVEKRLAQYPPRHKRGLDTGLCGKASSNGQLVSIGFQLREALDKFTASAFIGLSTRKLRRARLLKSGFTRHGRPFLWKSGRNVHPVLERPEHCIALYERWRRPDCFPAKLRASR
jgi:hypothetical protein